MKVIYRDLKSFIGELRNQDFAFYAACAYLIFSYLRPQAIYPALDFIPWTQVTIVLGLIYLAIKRRLKIQSSHTILFIFFLVILASCFNSQYPDVSFNKLSVIYIWLIEVFFFTNCIRTPSQFRAITILLFLILFKMSFFGARTWVGRGFGFTKWGIAGPSGFFANSGEFSLLMAMLAVMSLAFIFGHKNTSKIYYILPLTAIMTVLGASSRGGQLALAIGGLVLLVWIGKIRLKNIIILVLGACIAFSLLPEQQKERFRNIGSDATSESRLIYWEKGLEMMNEHKLLGVGFYGFRPYFSEHYSGTTDSTLASHRSEVAHNSLIEVGAATGYLGLAFYCWMLYLCHHLNRKTRKLFLRREHNVQDDWIYRYTIGLDVALIVYFIGSFFMSVAFYPYIYLLIMLSQSLYNATIKDVKHLPYNTLRTT